MVIGRHLGNFSFILLFHHGTTAPLDQGLHIIEDSRFYNQTHNTWKDSSGRVISPTQRPLQNNTQHSQQTSMTPAGYELNPSKRGAVDLRHKHRFLS